MQFKLVIAGAGDRAKVMQHCSVLKWHKREGEEVRPGDDLLDVKGEFVVRSGQPGLRQAMRPRRDVRYRPAVLRITSSDKGILRKLYFREGEGGEAGDPVALLSTGPEEILDESQHALERAIMFRIVSNPVATDKGEKFADQVPRVENAIVIRSDHDNGNRIGIYSRTGFTGLPIFGMAPMIGANLQGKCCIHYPQGQLDVRSDLLLQNSTGVSTQEINEIADRLRVPRTTLRSWRLGRTFQVQSSEGKEEFPTTVLVFSIAADVESPCFRHNQHGLLVPGEARLDELEPGEGLEWFQQTFTPIGRLTVDDFRESFGRLVCSVQQKTGAHVLVINSCTSAPRALEHSYQFIEGHPAQRRLAFNIALAELSRELDFSVLDIDRIMKRHGTGGQLDWDSVVPDMFLPVAEEAYRILRLRKLVA